MFGETIAGANRVPVGLIAIPNTNVVLWAAPTSSVLALDPWGLTGCSAYVDFFSPGFQSFTGVTNAIGLWSLSVNLPSWYSGPAYLQFAYVHPGLNPAGIATTAGVGMTVVQ